MARPHLEVADVLTAHGDAYIARHRGHLSRGQLKVMGAIRACRTAALGGHVARCAGCDHVAVAYNSCRNRHCPKCQGQTARAWLAERQADLLPVPSYHVVFTLPAPIAAIAFQNKAVVYDLLFRTAADTLLTIAPTRGTSAPGSASPPCSTPGARRSPTTRMCTSWCPTAGSPRTGRAGSPAAPGSSCQCGSSPTCSAGCSWTGSRLRMAPGGSEWVVYAKRPFAGPEAVLAYLSRYTHRVAIANSRLLAFDDRGVTFRWKDYRARDGATGRAWIKTMTLSADEFIRRFLLHVLPDGLHRIRHYGLFASGARAVNIARIRSLLALAPPSDEVDPQPAHNEPPAPACPYCGGRLTIVERFRPGTHPRTRPTAAIRIDTS